MGLLTRRLWFKDRDETVRVDESFLWTDLRPIVILGEAGMGKSTVLEQIESTPGYRLCTARKLINSLNPAGLLGDSHTFVIDALDEVAAHRDGDALDLVLRQLGAAGYPRFVLSCRVADWRSAANLQGIADAYGRRVVELHLDPLDRSDAFAFLEPTLGVEKAEETLAHLEARSLAGLWSNPQTLILVEIVASQGKLPASKGELFAEATKLMLREHREEKAATPLAEMADEDVLTAAGAAFAALILSGKGALSRQMKPDDEAIALREIAKLPGAARIGDILSSRLFMARGPERFTYAHRAIGEFLGARWLAANADSPRKRRRLLELFHHQGLVPASLRGLHAWLAWHGPSLAVAVIAVDPMGVVEYGDADRLSPAEGRAMFTALDALSQENPRFRAWTEYRVAGLVQKELLPEVARVLTASGVEFGLRMMILQALKGSVLVRDLTPILLGIVRDPKAVFATRSEAIDRLAVLDAEIEWPALLDQLLAERVQNSVRLASEMMGEVGFDRFSDAQILGVVLAFLPHSERTVGVYYGLERGLPDERIDQLLDGLAAAVTAPSGLQVQPGFDSLIDLANGLIARRLDIGSVAPERLWTWMLPFSSDGAYHRRAREGVAKVLARETTLRRAIQKIALLDEPGERNVFQRVWRLNRRSAGLAPTEEDVVNLLEALANSDSRWREVVQLVTHTLKDGVAVREVAVRFTAGDEEAAGWLAGLVNPPAPDWQPREEKLQRDRSERREAKWAEHRTQFSVADLRAGRFSSVLQPAKAYLKLFQDIGDESDDGPARIRKWLGPEIAEASLVGFETFLQAEPPKPTATEIAESFAENLRWDAGYIISAAFAERARSGRGYEDLNNERLMAGLFELRHISDHAGVPDLEPAIARILRERGGWEAAQRLYFEPQFARRLSYVDALPCFMRDADDRTLATALGIDWLNRYPDMSLIAEVELVDHLLSEPAGQAALSELVPGRRAREELSSERRRLWDAVGLILRFEETRKALEAEGKIAPELLWDVRRRQSGSGGERETISLTADQLAWTIRTFRGLFPMWRRPDGVTLGDTNAWDASNYLEALINRLGGDASAQAMSHLQALRDENSDGYNEALRVASAEQRRKQVEANWAPPDFATIAATLKDVAPTTSAQLQAVLIEEFAVVQAKVLGSDVDWYKRFYADDGRPRVEDDCRDAILQMFGSLPFDIHAAPEGHVGDDKRIDIICTLGQLMVPIEIKGQWHPQLWSASDSQLDHLYVNDWRADRGIYLVLWFGPDSSKKITKPSGETPIPTTPHDLREALIAQSSAARDGRSHIIVLDLTRP